MVVVHAVATDDVNVKILILENIASSVQEMQFAFPRPVTQTETVLLVLWKFLINFLH